MVTRYGDAFIPDQMIAAGPLEGGRGTCVGDGGTPLVNPLGAQDVLIGADSFGGGCGAPNGPPVFTQFNQGPLADFVGSHVFRPANDRFADAQGLPGNAGSTSGSTVNATLDPDEFPFAETSVWYSWTPTQSGPARVTVNQHQFDSELTVFTGDVITTLTIITASDDFGGTLQSQVDIAVAAGQTFRFMIEGFGPVRGNTVLNYTRVG
jgi:hypothetical protein